MLDQPIDIIEAPVEAPAEPALIPRLKPLTQKVVPNTDGESVTTEYIGLDGGLYTVQLPNRCLPEVAVDAPEMSEYLETFLVEAKLSFLDEFNAKRR